MHRFQRTCRCPTRRRCIAPCRGGLGRFGATHARKLAGVPGFSLCALVDRAPTAHPGAGLAALPLLCHVDDLPPDIASATVATSDEAHAEVALVLMRRGCHVLVEKPLCTDPRDGARMVHAAQEYGLTLSTGHIERFNPAWDEGLLQRLRHGATAHPAVSPLLVAQGSGQRQRPGPDGA